MTSTAIQGHPASVPQAFHEPSAIERLERTVSEPKALRRRVSGLGWFSIGLGLAELLAPDAITELIGARKGDRQWLVRAFGARELLAGLGILSGRRTAGWMWARVAGDVLDVTALGLVSSRARRQHRPRTARAIAAVAGVTALDVLTAVQATRNPPGELTRAIDVKRSVTIKRSPTEVYDRFRQLENLPRFMTHLESVTVHGEKRSTWRVKAPLGMTVEWDAEITQDIPHALLAWRSLPGATVPNGGSVRFRPAPGNQGTEVNVHLKYEVPGGKLARVFALLFGEEPSVQLVSDLLRFKQMLELGDVVDSDASVHQGPHPGRPSNGSNGKQVHP